jgi:hypothetical protein
MTTKKLFGIFLDIESAFICGLKILCLAKRYVLFDKSLHPASGGALLRSKQSADERKYTQI